MSSCVNTTRHLDPRRRCVLAHIVLALGCGPPIGVDDDGVGRFEDADDGNVLESLVVTDQSGAQFGWFCYDHEDHVDCDTPWLGGTPPQSPECGRETRDWVVSARRFIEIAGLCWSDGFADSVRWEGRFVVCETDEDCPSTLLPDGDEYECRSGLCQNTDTLRYPRGLPTMADALVLCEGVGPRQLELVGPLGDAVDAACPDHTYPFEPCAYLPAGCIDPR